MRWQRAGLPEPEPAKLYEISISIGPCEKAGAMELLERVADEVGDTLGAAVALPEVDGDE